MGILKDSQTPESYEKWLPKLPGKNRFEEAPVKVQ